MAQNADNIQLARAKTDGAAYIGGSSASLPNGAASDLAGFSSMGYIAEDGIVMTINRSVENIKEMGGDVALTVQTEHSVQFKFTPLEFMNATVKKENFGDDNVDSEGNVTIDGKELPEKKLVFDLRGRNNALIRIVVPRAKVSSQGELGFAGSSPSTMELTYDALPDENGVKAKIYFGAAA